MKDNNAPWIKNYGDVPFHLTYPTTTMAETVFDTADKNQTTKALSFMGKKTSFKLLKERILKTAKALKAIGIQEDDVVTIVMPNVPQAVVCLYAINYVGAVASMIHPLSAVGELETYLKETKSKVVITLDMFYKKLKEVNNTVPLDKIIIATMPEALSLVMKAGYGLTIGRKVQKEALDSNAIKYKTFIKKGLTYKGNIHANKTKDDVAVILFSGGTTGKTKGIKLSNLNFNALALQTAAMSHEKIQESRMLAAMPVFHGFGLGVCIHTMMVAGGTSILVPKFNVKSYAKLLKREKPNFIAGVPTLFESLTRNPYMDKVDLSQLKGVFSGGDSLSIELKKKLDKFLKEHNCRVKVREGYGTTECVTASCLTPYDVEKEGSIGFPYPDTYYTICKPNTVEELGYNKEGEICLTGPSVMLGYLNNEEETENTLRPHSDGSVYLHTGDLGYIDEDGYVFFKQRLKRIIITSGYNVYPSQIENVIDSHPLVMASCAIGVKDPYKMQKIKVFLTLKSKVKDETLVKNEIMELCKKNIARYALPYEIEIRQELPKTLVGKIAYKVLEAEENVKVVNG